MKDKKRRLAVVPSESLEKYKRAGITWLDKYYNPGKYFDEVYLLSPEEREGRKEFGMQIIPTEGKKFKGWLKELKIDVVRAYGGYWACDLACNHKVSGIPVVVSVHDTNPKLLYSSIRKADFVFCVSTPVRKMVMTKFGDPGRLWILPNRVDLDTMKPYPKRHFGAMDSKYQFRFKILHVGRKSEEKNLENVIKALRILGGEYCLLAVGRGDTDTYINAAKEEKVLDRCFFIDSIPNDELARYYSWADCVCTPSRREGFGIVFIEALACEAIVVTSDLAPMNEYIQHMRNGLLVKDYENPEALAHMIRLGCENQELRGLLKKNARESVRPFEKSRVDALEVSYYEKILGMEENGVFDIPLWKRMHWAAEDTLKRCLPKAVKKGIRSVAPR